MIVHKLEMKYKVSILLFLALLIFFVAKLLTGVSGRSEDKLAEKIDCWDLKGYEEWILSGNGVLEKMPNVGYYTASRHNIRSKDKDYSVYQVTCNETDVEAHAVWNGVFIYSEDRFSEISLLDSYANVLDIEDINHDGYEEVIVMMGTGGNCWACTRREILQLKDGGVVNLTENINDLDAGAVVGVMELDGDDSEKELEFLESEWEFAFGLCHACSPYTIRIYKWDGDSYVDDSRSYPGIYEEQLSKAMQDWNEWECGTPNSGASDSCLSAALQVLLASDMLGRRDEGWHFFWENTKPELFEMHVDFDYAEESFEKARSALESQYKNGEPFRPTEKKEYIELLEESLENLNL